MSTSPSSYGWRVMAVLAVLCLVALTSTTSEARIPGHYRVVLIPIVGVTTDTEPAGAVVYVELGFTQRADKGGLHVDFSAEPGRFSPMARLAVTQAIHRVAKALELSTDSWSVALRVPHADLTIYGYSLSAMVGLSVAALANGEDVATDRVVTGAILPDGHIGPVGSVPKKVLAAAQAHIRRVVVPEEQDPADADWETPFLMHVSPVGSVKQAYDALTDQPLAPAP